MASDPQIGEPARAPRLLDVVRDCIRRKHYSLRTEQTYVQWIKRFIYFHGRRHPRELAEASVAAFLNQLSRKRARFPNNFAFRLAPEDAAEVVANCDPFARLRFPTAPPEAPKRRRIGFL